MKRQLMILSTVTAVYFIFVSAGCSSKPKLESGNDHPAVMEQTDEKTGEAAPAAEQPDTGKPKDHPAH